MSRSADCAIDWHTMNGCRFHPPGCLLHILCTACMPVPNREAVLVMFSWAYSGSPLSAEHSKAYDYFEVIVDLGEEARSLFMSVCRTTGERIRFHSAQIHDGSRRGMLYCHWRGSTECNIHNSAELTLFKASLSEVLVLSPLRSGLNPNADLRR